MTAVAAARDSLLLIVQSAVVFPQESVPLCVQCGSPTALALESMEIQGLREFGIVYDVPSRTLNCIKNPQTPRGGPHFLYHTGTLCQVVSMDANEEERTLKIFAIATGIFSLLEIPAHSGPVLRGKVAFRHETTRAHGPRQETAASRPFPGYIYDIYSPRALAMRAWRLSGSSGEAPEDITALTNTLCTNLAIDKRRRLELLACEMIAERLLLCISLMQKHGHGRTILACATCDGALADRSAMINVKGAKGSCGVYINTHGHVHQTVTVSHCLQSCDFIRLQGRPTARDTWFIGYAWQIAYCGHCFSHLGWRFSKVVEFPWLAEVDVPGETTFLGFCFESIREREYAEGDNFAGDDEVAEDAEEDDEADEEALLEEEGTDNAER